MDEPSDADLLLQFSTGIDAASAQLVERHAAAASGGERSAHGHQPARGTGRSHGDVARFRSRRSCRLHTITQAALVLKKVKEAASFRDYTWGTAAMETIYHPNSPASDASTDDGSAALLAYARTGDPNQLERVVRLHGEFVFAVCRRVLQHQSDAEDAVQATFIACMRSARQFQPRMGLRSWIGAIALNSARRALRSAHRRRAHESRAAPSAMEVIAPVNDDAAGCIPLRRALGRLDDQARLMLWLRFGEGLTVREIADLNRLPQSTVDSRLRRTLGLLRRLLPPLDLSAGMLGAACDLPERRLDLPLLLLRLEAERKRPAAGRLRPIIIGAAAAMLLLTMTALVLHASGSPTREAAAIAAPVASPDAAPPFMARASAAHLAALPRHSSAGIAGMASMAPPATKPIIIMEDDLFGDAAAMLALQIDARAGIQVSALSRTKQLHAVLRALDGSDSSKLMSNIATKLQAAGADAAILAAFRNGSLKLFGCSRNGGDTTMTVGQIPEAVAAKLQDGNAPSFCYGIYAAAPLADPKSMEFASEDRCCDAASGYPHAALPEDSIVLFSVDGPDSPLVAEFKKAQPTRVIYPLTFDDIMVVPLVMPQQNCVGCPPGDFGVRIIRIGEQWGDGTGRSPPNAHG